MSSSKNAKPALRIPHWLRVKLPDTAAFAATARELQGLGLHTVCTGARCPNIYECFQKRVAAFLIMGGVCTRACRYCNIGPGIVEPLDPDEPRRVAVAAAKLGLKHVVITSVTRDDLPDGGAAHFAATVATVRKRLPSSTIEVLIPDFQGDAEALDTVLEAAPEVVNHNVETVPRLYRDVRPQADYGRSLRLLERVADAGRPAKAGLMVGLGETDAEVLEVLEDIAATGARVVTVGQYMRPSAEHLPVARYVEPGRFEDYALHAKGLGLTAFCGPLVRSSYRAADLLED